MKQHKRITLSWRLLFKGIGVLIAACILAGVVYWHIPSEVAARACDGDAVRIFNPHRDGYFLARQQTTVTPIIPAGYQIEAQVVIHNDGFNGMLDAYPAEDYTAHYSCRAIPHGSVFQEQQWDTQLTHYTAPVLIK